MDKVKNSIAISLHNFRKWTISPRIYAVFISLFFYLHSLLSPIITFCSATGHTVSPYIFPYIMCQPLTVLLIMLGVVLLFCDAPFIELEQPYIILRSGRSQWVFGSIVYIALASAIFFLLIVLFTIIILLPVIHFSPEWGKVIGTLAQTSLGSQHGISIPFPQVIFTHYTPMHAMLLSYANSCLVAFTLGMTVFVFNLRFTKSIGIVFAATLVFWQMAVTKTWSGFLRYSPVSWVSLSKIDVTNNSLYPSIPYIYVVLLFVSALLIYSSVRLMQKTDIQVLKSV